MELRHIRYFLALAEELHFGRAARRLGISQPPLSQQIQALEIELGATLFERTSRQVHLTKAGATFLARAREILTSIDDAAAQTVQVHRGQHGTLRVGHVASAALRLVPDAVNRHRRSHPAVTISCQMRESVPALLELLRAGAIDVAILRAGAGDDQLVMKPIEVDRIHLAVPAEHPLAGSKNVTWARLLDEPFVHFPRSSAPDVHDQLNAFLVSRGMVMKVVAETSSILNILSLVASGMGVCLASDSLRTLQRDGVRYVTLKDPPRVATSIAYRPEAYRDLLPPFVATLREVVRARQRAARAEHPATNRK